MLQLVIGLTMITAGLCLAVYAFREMRQFEARHKRQSTQVTKFGLDHYDEWDGRK